MSQLLENPNNQTKTTGRSFWASNPVMRRLDKVYEVAETDCASYSGIASKTLYFLAFCAVGILLQLVLAPRLATGSLTEFSISGFQVRLFSGEMVALVASLVLALVFQLLAFFAQKTTPVTGALYCVTQGYFISFMVFTVLKGYEHYGALALLITMLIIVTMSFLYSRGIIKVDRKFKMVMVTLFVTMIGSSVLLFVGSLIPATRELVARIQGNFVIALIAGIAFIIIAALFLICDFATIDHVVEDQLPKQYEWNAAFGLSFTVLWLYLKVLDLIMTIAGRNKD